jgi:two-component system, OmpR family, sensor kinase
MASPASSTRSAAQATYSAYRRVPIRWRLAGGSAVLTLVILCGFAVIVGVLTTRQIRNDFHDQVSETATELARDSSVTAQTVKLRSGEVVRRARCSTPNLKVFGSADNAEIRVFLQDGTQLCGTSQGDPDLGFPQPDAVERDGYRIEARPIPTSDGGAAVLQYARPLSDVQRTASKVRVFLAFGVLGGAALALLAGLAVARRAMRPIAELTSTAREIAVTRDPSQRVPLPEANDEVAELAGTLDGMLGSLADARAETEGLLERQRAFVADASHELRTPLTSVLANLELLSDHLDGDLGDAADSALRSSQRMRRLVADLLLLARADAGREAPRAVTDLAAVVTEAAAELGPVAGGHDLELALEPVAVNGVRDDLHRVVANLIENAIRHTPPGTAVRVRLDAAHGRARLVVEDDGPGVPPELGARVFERFARAGGDTGGSSGLGLAIVRAVAEAHGGSVELEPGPGGRGARFLVDLPAVGATVPAVASEA